jgi:hypothetical protein
MIIVILFSPVTHMSVQVVVKIFTRILVHDVEYKTLSIRRTTTCREVIQMLLSKFRLKHRDPNLFFITIDVWTRKTGIPIRSVMVLDDRTCPAQLQEAYPQQGTKFTMQMRSGGFVRLLGDDSCLLTSTAVRLSPVPFPVFLFIFSFTRRICFACSNFNKEDVVRFPLREEATGRTGGGGEPRARLKDDTGILLISISLSRNACH